MILGIIETIEEWIEPFKDWVQTNHNNPIMWIAIFLIGLAVFAFTYNALNKNN